jgi:hypothetical protein
MDDERIDWCPHCGNETPKRLRHTQTYDEMFDEHQGYTVWIYVATCGTCSRVLLYKADETWRDHDFRHSAELVWPESGDLATSVPERVRWIYAEAARIKAVAPNAFTVQIRRALEAICDDRQVPKGTLQQRLASLVTRGEIPPLLGEMTDTLRLLGNVAAHAGQEDVSPGDVPTIDGFFRAVIEYVYIAPNSLKAFRERLEKRRAAPADENDE